MVPLTPSEDPVPDKFWMEIRERYDHLYTQFSIAVEEKTSIKLFPTAVRKKLANL